MSVKAKPWKNTPGKFQVQIYFRWPDKEPYRERTVIPAPSAANAKRWGEQREAELRAKGKTATKPLVLVPTLSEFIPKWAKVMTGKLRKTMGVSGDLRQMALHVEPFFGHLPLDKITDERVTELQNKWLEGGYKSPRSKRILKGTKSKSSHAGRLNALSSALKAALHLKLITELPCTITLPKIDDQREAPFHEHAIYERLVASAGEIGPKVLVVVLLGGDAGLRVGEMIGLEWVDVDRTVHVRRSVSEGIEGEPKGLKEKALPMTPRLEAALRQVPRTGPRVLYSDAGKPPTRKMISGWIRRAEKRAGLPSTGLIHILRHTYISHLAIAGVPMNVVKDLGRHSQLPTTARYMHLTKGALHDGVDMLTRSRGMGGSTVARADVESVSLDVFIPPNHPLRTVKRVAEDALLSLKPTLLQMRAVAYLVGTPEHTLLATLLMAIYRVNREADFCEQVGYNLLFRWFLGMSLAESIDTIVFARDRDWIIQQTGTQLFVRGVVDETCRKHPGAAKDLSLDQDVCALALRCIEPIKVEELLVPTVTFSRQELYELVWSKPMVHVAAEFGMTNNGFKKYCEKMSVPVPPRGYWARVGHGQHPSREPLRTVTTPESIAIPRHNRVPLETSAAT